MRVINTSVLLSSLSSVLVNQPGPAEVIQLSCENNENFIIGSGVQLAGACPQGGVIFVIIICARVSVHMLLRGPEFSLMRRILGNPPENLYLLPHR